MRKTIIDKKNVEIYDNIDELPIARFHVYNKMLLIDAGIGSDLNDWDAHVERILKYMDKGDTDSAKKELINTRQNIYFIQSGLSPKNLAFAALVRSIDGKECNDLTPEGLGAVLLNFNSISQTELTKMLNSVKKKIDDEINLYFPQLFDDVKTKEYFNMLCKRTMKALELLAKGEDPENDEDIKAMTADLITFTKPRQYSGKNSFEVEFDKQYETMCLTISRELNLNAKTMSVLEYYNSFEYIKDLRKREARQGAN